jgi:TBC1 domain family protein 5
MLQSPWNSLRQDEAMRAEIAQDVRRLPDDPFYHQERIQAMIIDILLVYCKLNPALGGYRQGMHELLAPVVYVVEQDAVDAGDDAHSSSSTDADLLMLQVLDPSFVEHDAFTLFSKVMDRAAPSYATGDATARLSPPNKQSSEPSAIVERSRHIHETCLHQVDPELSRHLTNIEILPQIFLM